MPSTKQLQLPPAACPIPSHWRTPPMPDAALYRHEGNALLAIDGDDALTLASGLQAMLEPAGAQATLFVHRDGEIWRLSPCGGGALYRLQSLAESRRRILTRLRAHLAGRLSAQILHELRNPMNALSLHADLLSRLIETPQGVARAGSSVQIVRDRLKDLSARQNAMVALWLAPVLPGEPCQQGLRLLIEDTQRMMRSHFSLHEVRSRTVDLERLERGAAVTVDARFELVLIGLLLLACDSVVALGAGADDAEIVIGVAETIDEARPKMTLRAPLPHAAPATGLDWGGRHVTIAEAIDELAFVLDDTGIVLHVPSGGTGVELEFAPS